MTESREQKVFQALLRQVDRVIDVESLYVALYDRRTASITFPLMAHKRNGRLEKFEAPWKSHEFRPDRLFPDSVFSDGSSLLLEKGVDPWLEEKGLDYASGPRVPESLLAVPLTIRGRVAAVLVVEDESQKGAYTSDHVRILQVMANRAAGTLAALRATERLQVLNEVGQALASRTRLGVEEILEVIHEQAGRLMDARNMYVALYDTGRQTLSFPLAYYDGDPENWDSREAVIGDEPQGGLTEEVIRRRSTFSPPNVDAWYRENGIEPNVDPVPESWLGVPLISGGHILGVIAVQNDEVPNLYGAADIEILEAMANQAAAALDNAQWVERLRVLTEVSRRLTSGSRLDEGQILDLIFEQASLLMDTRNMYVAIYEKEANRLTFPLAYYEGNRESDWPSRIVDPDYGLTDWVIINKAPLCPPDVIAWYDQIGVDPAVLPVPESWAGVPIMREGQVLGVIAIQNDNTPQIYRQVDIETLQIMADQAAIALENARFYSQMEELVRQRTLQLEKRTQQLQESQQRVIAAERLAAVSSVAGELVHKMNNLAGTIPARVKLIKEHLGAEDVSDSRVNKYLDGILGDSVRLLDEAKRLRESTAPEALTQVDASEMLHLALERVQHSLASEFESGNVQVSEYYANEPLVFDAPRNPFLTALENIIRNAVEAMPEGGLLTLKSEAQADDGIVLSIKDTGVGIDPSSLPKLFDPFYTTKEDDSGMGFGLWQARTVVRSVGGDVDVQLDENLGTTFLLRLPFRSVLPNDSESR